MMTLGSWMRTLAVLVLCCVLWPLAAGCGDGGRTGNGNSGRVEMREQLDNALSNADPEALTLTQELGNEACGVIAARIADPDEEVRLMAVHCLGLVDDPEASSLLCNAMGDGSGSVRSLALLTIDEDPSPECADRYRKHLKSPDSGIRGGVSKLLGLLDDGTATADIEKALAAETSPVAKADMILALTRLGSEDHAKVFLSGLHDDDPFVRYDVVMDFAYVSSPAFTHNLVPLLEDRAPVFPLKGAGEPLTGRICDAVVIVVRDLHPDDFPLESMQIRAFSDEDLQTIRGFLTDRYGDSDG